MNTVTGTLVTSGEGLGDALAVDLPGGRVSVPAHLESAVRAAGVTDVVVGARPEDLRFGSADGVRAGVVAVESLGHERHVVCRLADDQLVIVRQAVHDAAPAVDESVVLVADVDAIHVFDPESGMRIG